MKMNKTTLALATGACLLFGAGQAMAITNGSFESGVSGWNSVGSVNSFEGYRGVATTDGASHLMLSTNRTASGNQGALGSAANSGALNSFLGGVNFNSLYPGRSTFDGSAVSQSVTVTEDSTLSFDWALGHQSGNSPANDAAFVLVRDSQGEVVSFQTIARLASTELNKVSTDGWKLSETSTFANLPTLSAGNYTVYVGVLNVMSAAGRTALLLDNFQLTSLSGSANVVIETGQEQATPEPMTAGMTMLGLGALAYATRRRRVNNDNE